MISLAPKAAFAALLLSLPAPALFAAPGKAPLPLVAEGRGAGVVVIPEAAPPSVRKLADDFVGIVRRATGAALPIVTDANAAATAEGGGTRLFLGECRQTAEAGLALAGMEEEAYRIAIRGHSAFVLGRPAKPILRPGSKIDSWYDSDPMRWALNQLLEDELGVRWLWPGRLGTYVPKASNFAIPAKEKTYQPRLKMRTLVIPPMRSAGEAKIRAEALEWVSNHQGGERGAIPLAHGFNDWWSRYHATHPDYFATPPPGEKQRPPGYVKLALANPAVLDQIAKNYEEAGKPRYWNITPNDGTGFDVSEAVRRWDIPPNQPVADIWQARANLTARYVFWWNRIYERLSALNPEVTLVTMAYSSYRMPPPPERPLKARAIIGIVPSYRAYDVWEGWAAQADELILRPNWGHYGANGPHLPLREIADYMNFTAKHKMIGFYMDSVLGFWGTQGLNYYLMARLMVHPEWPAQKAVDEYVSAFGAGAPKVREYFDFWQQLTAEWAHGHKIYKVPEGKYDALIREGKIVDNPIIGPRQALPYIYTDEVLAKAYALLDEAAGVIGDSKSEATQRVEFLRHGLDELKASRDCIALGAQVEKTRDKALLRVFREKADALETLRAALTPSHVIWGAIATRREDRVKIKIRPRNLRFQESTGEDQF